MESILIGQMKSKNLNFYLRDDLTGLVYQLALMNGDLYFEESDSYTYEKPVLTDRSTGDRITFGIENASFYYMEV